MSGLKLLFVPHNVPRVATTETPATVPAVSDLLMFDLLVGRGNTLNVEESIEESIVETRYEAYIWSLHKSNDAVGARVLQRRGPNYRATNGHNLSVRNIAHRIGALLQDS